MNCLSADLAFDPAVLREHMIGAFSERSHLDSVFHEDSCLYTDHASSVLLLLGELPPEEGSAPEVCIILNKRSKVVKQPGDLCCPGGAVEKLDRSLAHLLTLPGTSLSRWPRWSELKKEQPVNAQFLSLLYAASLREAWEEMGLNPFRLVFLGPLSSQCLVLFERSVYPMVAWTSRQKKFRRSWEVEEIVNFPLRALLNPSNYAHYKRYIPAHLESRFADYPNFSTSGRSSVLSSESSVPPFCGTVDFPCFVCKSGGKTEILWGVTFKIVAQFLEMIFGFQVPDPEKLPVISDTLDEEYVSGPK